MENFTAKIIGEKSAGLTAIEIYKNDDLIWSMDFFEMGASDKRYHDGIRQAYDTAMDCADVESWADNLHDEQVCFNDSDTTWIVAEYSPDTGWKFSDPEHDGQAWDFIKINSDRIPVDIVRAWEDFSA